MATVNWDSSFEGTPAGSDNPSGGDDRIREHKENLRVRLEKEHDWATTPGTFATQGTHKAGSAMAYTDADPATNVTDRPDGSTAFTAADEGRLAIDTTSNQLQWLNGSQVWTDIDVVESQVTITGGTEDNLVSIDASGNIQDSGSHGADGVLSTGTGTPVMRVKVIEIGTWNMDTTSSVTVGLGTGIAAKTRLIQVIIRRDDDALRFPLTHASSYTPLEGSVFLTLSTDVANLNRRSSGWFDGTNYDTMGDDGNRGWVTIWYEE